MHSVRSISLFTAFLVLLAGCLAAPPVAAAPRLVELGLFLVDISALDERAETYTAEFDVIMRWRDPARAYEPKPGEKIPRVVAGAAVGPFLDVGWKPEIFAVNVIDASDQGRPRVLISPDGTVTQRNRLRRTLRTQLDFRAFPFDRQVLAVHVESLVHDSDALDLEAEDEFTGFDPDFEMSEWTVRGLTTTHTSRMRMQERQDFDRLSFEVHLERQTGYYVWKIMLPMVVIVLLSWIVFWMTEEMLGRRAGVSSTGMLTVIAYQFIVAGSLPRFPYQTVMDRFTLVSLLTIAATMLVNLVGSRLAPEKRLLLDRSCRVVFPVGYAVALALVLLGGREDG